MPDPRNNPEDALQLFYGELDQRHLAPTHDEVSPEFEQYYAKVHELQVDRAELGPGDRPVVLLRLQRQVDELDEAVLEGRDRDGQGRAIGLLGGHLGSLSRYRSGR